MNKTFRRRTAMVGVTALVAGVTTFVASAASADASCLITSDYGSPGNHTFVVPADVTSIQVDVFGAEGGITTGHGGGGRGARAQVTVPVDAGDTLDLVVGGKGGDVPNAIGSGATRGLGGFGGGGDGGATPTGSSGHGGAGGGGASSVRGYGGTLVIVAGGGGGGTHGGVGGHGGEVGQPGTRVAGSTAGAGVGGGGTASAGGAGGEPGTQGTAGEAGAGYQAGVGYGVGGLGGASSTTTPDSGGGGGGGWYGGGGGGGAQGTTQGSSGGGGGGSSHSTAPGTTFSTGANAGNAGNGLIRISYVEPDCADLALTKSVYSVSGRTIIYSLEVANNSPNDATGVEIVDTLPAGVTYVSDTCGGTTPVGGVWTSGTQTVAAFDSYSCQLTVEAATVGSYLNEASVSGDQYDPVPGNNDDTASVTLVESADLVVTKTASVASAVVGTQVVYTIDVANDGPDDAEGVLVTDELPAGVTYVSDTCGGSLSGTTWTWPLTGLDVGDDVSCDIAVDVVGAGSIVNSASAAHTGGIVDPDTSNNTDTATITGVLNVDVHVTIDVSDTEVQAGDTVTYTVVVGNDGPHDATGVVAGTVLSAGQTFVSSNCGATLVSGVVTWNVGDLDVDDTLTCELVVTVDAPGGASATSTVTANEHDIDLSNNTDNAGVSATPIIDLEIALDVSAPTALVGDQVVYTITVGNNGPHGATGVVVTDVLPTGVTYVSDTCGGLVGPPWTWTIGDLDASDDRTCEITVEVAATGTIVNTVTVAGNEDESTLTNNAASVDLTGLPVVDLEVTIDVSDTEVIFGDDVTYTITVGNNGPHDATAVVVTFPLPTDVVYLSNTCGATVVVGDLVWSVGDLDADEERSCEVVVEPTALGEHPSTVSVTGTEHDPNLGNNADDTTFTVVPVVDLAITVSASVDEVLVGGQVVLSFDITNLGPFDATDVIVTYPVPTGATVVGDPCGTIIGDLWVWSIGDLAAGDDVSCDVTIELTEAGVFVNEATVEAAEHERILTNNVDAATVVAGVVVDLEVEVEVDDPEVEVGDQFVYRLVVTNHGPHDATGVTVTGTLPAGVRYLSDTCGGSRSGTTWTWEIGDLAVGESVECDITVEVLAAGDLRFAAVVSANETDTVAANDDDAVTVTARPVVVAPPPAPGTGRHPHTGAPVLALLGFGGGVLAAGSAMLYGARPVRRPREQATDTD